MHKVSLFEATIRLNIYPDGPLLIKAEGGADADPTLPDMQFVRTHQAGRMQVYLPGSSLRGAIRAHCEEICRALDGGDPDPDRDDPPLADNPLGSGSHYGGMGDMTYNSGRYLESIRSEAHSPSERTALIYRRSSLVSQVFGHTALAGRVRFADAYSIDEPLLEERSSLAIDRIFSSVAVGPFNYEVVVAGSFATRIDVTNVTLAQFALLGLALRDLGEGKITLGFGKSRGLGRVRIRFDGIEIGYPTCTLIDGHMRRIGGQATIGNDQLAGIGALMDEAMRQEYGLSADDLVPLPAGFVYTTDELLGVYLKADGDEATRVLWRACMPAWRRRIGL